MPFTIGCVTFSFRPLPPRLHHLDELDNVRVKDKAKNESLLSPSRQPYKTADLGTRGALPDNDNLAQNLIYTMPVANSPEQKVKAAHEASETLDRVRALDTRLPDVGDLFTGTFTHLHLLFPPPPPDTLLSASSSGSYSIPGANAVAPFLVKQNITLPPLGLEHLRNCKYLVGWGVTLCCESVYLIGHVCVCVFTGKSDNSAGIFPEIERAFFTVENRLYLWNYMERYKKRHQQCKVCCQVLNSMLSIGRI